MRQVALELLLPHLTTLLVPPRQGHTGLLTPTIARTHSLLLINLAVDLTQIFSLFDTFPDGLKASLMLFCLGRR